MPELQIGDILLMPIIVAVVEALKRLAKLPTQWAPVATAILAVVGYGLAFAPANRTGRSYGEKSLISGDLPHTAALPAGLRAGSRFASISIAFRANFHFFSFNFGFSPKSGLHKAEVEIIAQVSSPPGSGPRTPPTPESEKILEYIAET